MAVISFYTYTDDQVGNSTSAMALATYLGIVQNKKILFISTAYNDNRTRHAFWSSGVKKKSGLFGPNTATVSDNGIEGLDRIIRSNKISPDIVTDYTKVALKNRLEILFGYNGAVEQYGMIQQNYVQIINIASKYYDTVIVDVDKKLEKKTILDILNVSDINIATTTQKLEDLDIITKTINEGSLFRKVNTLIVIGKYDDNSKYNIKNISRNYLKQKNPINTIPYNTLLFEAMQEGQIIDLMLRLLNLKGKDENTFFLDEVKRLSETIDKKTLEIKQMGL